MLLSVLMKFPWQIIENPLAKNNVQLHSFMSIKPDGIIQLLTDPSKGLGYGELLIPEDAQDNLGKCTF